MELHFISSLTHTDLSKSSELVLFQSRGRAPAKLESPSKVPLCSPIGEHSEVTPVLRPSPVWKSSWEGRATAALWIRSDFNNSPQSEEDPFHLPNLRAVTPQFPRLWIPSLTIFCLRILSDSPSAFSSPGKIILEDESGKCSCLAFSQSIKEPKIQTSVPLAEESSPQGFSEWVFQDCPRADSSIEQMKPHIRETLFSPWNTGWDDRKSCSKRVFG